MPARSRHASGLWNHTRLPVLWGCSRDHELPDDHVADSQECRVESGLTGEPISMDLRVSAAPFYFQGEEFTVCALRDITDEKRRQVLERTFFHDILNSAGGLKAMVEIVDQLHGEEAKAVKETVRNLTSQIVEEIQSHRDLVAAEAGELGVKILDVNVAELLDRVCTSIDGIRSVLARRSSWPHLGSNP